MRAARRREVVVAFDLDETKPARRARRQPVIVAKRRNVNSCAPAGTQNCTAVGRFTRLSIDDDVCHSGASSKFQFSPVVVCLGIGLHGQTQSARYVLHLVIVGKDRRGDALKFFITSDQNERAEQLRAESLPLPLIADDEGELRLVRAVNFAQTTDTENLLLAGLRIAAFHHEHHLAVVIDEADSAQTFVRDALIEL